MTDDIRFDRDMQTLLEQLPEEQLPLVLPQVESYEPTDDGESPLSKMTDWVNTTCPCWSSCRRSSCRRPG